MNKCIRLTKIYKKLTKNLKLCMYINKKIKIYLAEFMKTAPAGNSLGHTVSLDLNKGTQLLLIRLLKLMRLSSWLLISKEIFKPMKKTSSTWPSLAAFRLYMTETA